MFSRSVRAKLFRNSSEAWRERSPKYLEDVRVADQYNPNEAIFWKESDFSKPREKQNCFKKFLSLAHLIVMNCARRLFAFANCFYRYTNLTQVVPVTRTLIGQRPTGAGPFFRMDQCGVQSFASGE